MARGCIFKVKASSRTVDKPEEEFTDTKRINHEEVFVRLLSIITVLLSFVSYSFAEDFSEPMYFSTPSETSEEEFEGPENIEAYANKNSVKTHLVAGTLTVAAIASSIGIAKFIVSSIFRWFHGLCHYRKTDMKNQTAKSASINRHKRRGLLHFVSPGDDSIGANILYRGNSETAEGTMRQLAESQLEQAPETETFELVAILTNALKNGKKRILLDLVNSLSVEQMQSLGLELLESLNAHFIYYPSKRGAEIPERIASAIRFLKLGIS